MEDCRKEANFIQYHKPILWTKEKVLESAQKYEYETLWKKEDIGAYNAALKYGYLEECRLNFKYEKKRKKDGFWTKKQILEETEKYNSEKEWRENSQSSYTIASREGWLEEIRKVFKPREIAVFGQKEKRKSPNFWTKEKIMEDAKKYDDVHIWLSNSGGAYNAAKKLGIYETVTVHMKKNKVPAGTWTKERCKVDADQCKNSSDWKELFPLSYAAASQHGWLKELSFHFVKKKRKIFWTDEVILMDARKYPTQKDWKINSMNGYNAALKAGLLKQATAHMNKETMKPMGHWNIEENVISDALLYTEKNKWRRSSSGAYKGAKRLGIMEKATSHMNGNKIKPMGYWTKEKVIAGAAKYFTVTDWKKNSMYSYNLACKENWLPLCVLKSEVIA